MIRKHVPDRQHSKSSSSCNSSGGDDQVKAADMRDSLDSIDKEPVINQDQSNDFGDLVIDKITDKTKKYLQFKKQQIEQKNRPLHKKKPGPKPKKEKKVKVPDDKDLKPMNVEQMMAADPMSQMSMNTNIVEGTAVDNEA